MMPYVTSIMLMLVEKLLMTKNADAMTLPMIVTSRMPSLLAMALASGPVDKKKHRTHQTSQKHH